MNKVVVVMVKPLEFLPPVMSLLQTLRSIGREPVFVGVKSNAGDLFLRQNGFELHYIPFDGELYRNDTIGSKFTHRLRRAWNFYPRRKILRDIIKKISSRYGAVTVWFAEVQSAALLGDAWREYRYRIVTIYELADFNGKSWWGFSFFDFIRTTEVVEPERNRAEYVRRYLNLPKTPMVVANKSCGHPRKLDLNGLPEQVRDLGIKAAGRPIFLYQGVWTEDRKDVGTVLETIAKNRPGYCVAVMPGTAAVESLARKYNNVFVLAYMPPPGHLAATSIASVGIAIYNPSGKTELERNNALFCAPNKIYEYAGFGIPTLGNRIPGLIDTVERAGAGVCVDVCVRDILAGADCLVRNLDSYRKAANRFFDDTDLDEQVQTVLKGAEES